MNEKRKRTPSRKVRLKKDTEEILDKQISELVKPSAPTRVKESGFCEKQTE